MTKSERLLQLMQLLRLHRVPVAGETLAEELGVSLCTIYRDIGALQAQGADIEGTPDRGYRLKPGFLVPPLMFTEEEIEALVLGTRWVAARTDPTLSRAGRSALARIAAVLPADLGDHLEQTALYVPEVRPVRATAFLREGASSRAQPSVAGQRATRRPPRSYPRSAKVS